MRRAVVAVIALVVTVVGAPVGSAAAATASAPTAAPISTAPAEPSPGRYALGDSVMLGAKSELKALGFGTVNAVTSRQSYSGPAILRKRGASLPADVVVHLGTNGTLPLSTCKAMVSAAGPSRRVYLVTIHVDRSWTRGNNKVIRQCAAQYPAGRVTVIDWDWAASRHPAWLYSDGAHLKPNGARAFARIIDEAIDRRIAAG